MIEGNEELRLHVEPYKIVKGDQPINKLNFSLLLPESKNQYKNSEGEIVEEEVVHREVEEFVIGESIVDDFVFKSIVELLYGRSKMGLLDAENTHETAKDNVKELMSRMNLGGYSDEKVDMVLDEYHKPDMVQQEKPEEEQKQE